MPYTYILFSEQLNRFYVGSTAGTPEDRLKKHLYKHWGYTGNAKDWKIVWARFHLEISEALLLERRIKGWKSLEKIKELINSGN